MKIKLTDALNEPGGKVSVSGDINTDNFIYHGDEYEFACAPHFNGTLTNNSQELVLAGTVKAEFYAKCARCLEKTRQTLDYGVEEVFVRESGNDDSDAVIFSGDEIEPDEVIMSGFFVNAPSRYLCSEDCKGLCPECGANLNKGECGCNREYTDPRWDALRKIMDSNKDS